jgi:hypothetical protein
VIAALSNKSVTERKASAEPGMVVTAGILFIVLISGKNLKKMDVLSMLLPSIERFRFLLVVQSSLHSCHYRCIICTGDSDPFCVFSNGRQKVKSKAIDDNNNPDWGRVYSSIITTNPHDVSYHVYDGSWHGMCMYSKEHLSLSMENLSIPILLQVFDVDPTSNELMGSASVDVSKLVPGVETEVTWHLLILSFFFLGSPEVWYVWNGMVQ